MSAPASVPLASLFAGQVFQLYPKLKACPSCHTEFADCPPNLLSACFGAADYAAKIDLQAYFAL